MSLPFPCHPCHFQAHLEPLKSSHVGTGCPSSKSDLKLQFQVDSCNEVIILWYEPLDLNFIYAIFTTFVFVKVTMHSGDQSQDYRFEIKVSTGERGEQPTIKMIAKCKDLSSQCLIWQMVSW